MGKLRGCLAFALCFIFNLPQGRFWEPLICIYLGSYVGGFLASKFGSKFGKEVAAKFDIIQCVVALAFISGLMFLGIYIFGASTIAFMLIASVSCSVGLYFGCELGEFVSDFFYELKHIHTTSAFDSYNQLLGGLAGAICGELFGGILGSLASLVLWTIIGIWGILHVAHILAHLLMPPLSKSKQQSKTLISS